MEETLEKSREALYLEKKREFFSFFLDGLPIAELAALADKITGRVKILEKKLQKDIEASGKPTNDDEEESE